MGLNNYPYTNFHELNADWILEQLKEEKAKVLALETWKTGTDSEIAALTDRLTTVENFISDIESGIVPQEFLDSLMAYVQNNFDTLAEPLQEQIDTNSASISSINSKLASKLDNLKIANVIQYGADSTGVNDSTVAIQDAIDENDIIIFDKGTYLSNRITIPSGKYIIGYAAEIVCTDSIMFLNDYNGSGSYDSNSDIHIEGIQFTKASSVSNCGFIALGHMKNAEISNCIFNNSEGYHNIELNACQNIRIVNNRFQSQRYVEAVQLDYALDYASFPFWQNYIYDNTICNDIVIDSNTFINTIWDPNNSNYQPACIGSHNANNRVTNVRIINNFVNRFNTFVHFAGLFEEGSIDNNIVYGCLRGVELEGSHRSSISNNKLVSIYASANSNAENCGISLKTANQIEHIDISHNIIKNFNAHGISVKGNIIMIANNMINGCGMHGIYIPGDCTQAMIENNVTAGNHVRGGSYYDMYVDSALSVLTMAGNHWIVNNAVSTSSFNNTGSNTQNSQIALNRFTTKTVSGSGYVQHANYMNGSFN